MNLKSKILDISLSGGNKKSPAILADFKFKTDKKNQLLAFFKPEAFLNKTPAQLEKILDLVFDKLEKYDVSIDGAATYPGPTIKKYSIMDKHYGVINTLSKDASKILTKDERDLVFKTLGVKDKNTRILGGHEAFEVSGFGSTYDFDNYWLEVPSNRVRSGFYVRTMKIGGRDTVVVNGFHPQQLAHYTDEDRNLVLMLVSTNSPWAKLRLDMIGETFPGKALPSSIRGTLFAKPKNFGFKKVGVDNNVVHLSAGPTEALFEMDNFLNKPFGIDIIKEGAKLAQQLIKSGFKRGEIERVMNDKDIHAVLEHKDTEEAAKYITSKVS